MTNRALKIVARVCRVLLAVTFLFSGFVKTVDPWGTAIKVNEYLAIYGFENLHRLSFGFSIWLCGAELMMGCMLLFRVRIRLVSIFAFASMIFFTILTFLSATWLPVEDCGCFGDAVKLTPWQTFAKNLVLLPMAAVVWWRYRRDRIFAFSRREVACTVLFFCLSMGLGIYCYRHLPLIDFRPFKVGVNLYEAMNAYDAEPEEEELQMVLVYRNKRNGRLREFALEDKAWRDTTRWEWVRTETGRPPRGWYERLCRLLSSPREPKVDPSLSEFSIRDAEGDATAQMLTLPGRLYMLCVTDFGELSADCEARMGALVERASAEGAQVICLTPQPLREVTWRSFAGSERVRCYNVDATTMKTMLRAMNGLVQLDDGVISRKLNCRDL